MTSPWLTTDEAAQLVRFIRKDGSADLRALRRYLKRECVQTVLRGRKLLIRRADLEDTLTPLGPRRVDSRRTA